MNRLKKILLILIAVFFVASWTYAGPEKHPRFIFLFIGDGMGLAQTAAAELYLNALKHDGNPAYTERELTVTSFPVTGLMTTHSADDYITDSAAAGTAMATGTKAKNGFFSTGKKKLLTEYFIEKGYRAAILTNVPADHATPAAFYTRGLPRKDYYNIALEMMRSPVDIVAGAYVLGNRPRTREGRPDLFQENLKRVRVSLSEKKISWPADKGTRVLLIPDEEMVQFPYAIDDPDNGMLEKAFLSIIDRLDGDPFFFVIEGGSIDWACHSNDTATMIHEVIGFNRVISKAVKFYHEHPEDTLILVTGDHETGGLSLGSGKADSLYPALIREQQCSSEMMAIRTKGSTQPFENVIRVFFGEDFYRYLVDNGKESDLKSRWKKIRQEKDLYTRLNFFEEITKIFANRAGFSWSTGEHSGSPVPVWALGEGSREFTGLFDNTRFYEKILQLTP